MDYIATSVRFLEDVTVECTFIDGYYNNTIRDGVNFLFSRLPFVIWLTIFTYVHFKSFLQVLLP